MKNKAFETWKTWKYAIISAVLIIGILLYAGIKAYAATYPFRSKGRIVYDNGTADASDDVIFDAADFEYLYNLALAEYVPEGQ